MNGESMASPKARTREETRSINQFLKGQLGPIRPSLSLSVGLSLSSGLLLIVQMWLLAQIVGEVLVKNAPLATLWPMLATLLPIYLVRSGLTFLAERVALSAAIDVKRSLRAELLGHLITVGPANRGNLATGDLATMLSDGIEALEGYFARYMPAMMMMVALPFAILVVVLPFDWLSAVVMVVTAPFIPIFMILIGEGTERLNQKQWRKLTRMAAHFLDMIQGLTTLKLFNASRREAEAVSLMAEDYRRSTMRVLRVAFLSSLVLEFFATVSIAIIAVFIGFRLLYGQMSFHHGFFVLLLAPDFYLPLRQMGTHYHARLEAIGAAERMVEVRAMKPGLVEASQSSEARSALPAMDDFVIEARDLAFAYEGGRVALEGVDFTIQAGQSIAFVGPSGAGKSTIFDLLLGLLSPSSGALTLNGVPFAHLPMADWRTKLAYVPQRPTLFAGTIAETIRFGAPDISDNTMIDAAKQAHAHDFIMAFPGGYDHVIDERGQGLSGGQIQRLAIARALARNAPLVLLDEPTAHLDAESEAEVNAALRALRQGRTMLTIAHRLASVRQANEIFVMEHGRIVEHGSHAALMAANGPYKRVARLYLEDMPQESKASCSAHNEEGRS